MNKIKFFDAEEETYDLSKPTKEEYEKSLKERDYFGNWIHMSRKRQNELLDELCEERSTEKLYLEMYEKHKDIIRRYEIYTELEAKN